MQKHIQVTLGAGATRVTETNIMAREIWFEAEANSSDPMAIGDENVSLSLGYNIQHATDNVPSSVHLGPYDAGPLVLSHYYGIGTEGELLNVHYIEF